MLLESLSYYLGAVALNYGYPILTFPYIAPYIPPVECAFSLCLKLQILLFWSLFLSSFNLRLVRLLSKFQVMVIMTISSLACAFFKMCKKASVQDLSFPHVFLPSHCFHSCTVCFSLFWGYCILWRYKNLSVYCASTCTVHSTNIRQWKNNVEWKLLNAWTKCY